MVKFTVDEMRGIMNKPNNIRNLTVIAHVDHGKSTLTDSLIGAAGIISTEDVGNIRFTHLTKDEQERGITIKSTGISLYFENPPEKQLPPKSEGKSFLINLIDSPGHVDFSSEVTAALRVTDGCLVVVDVVEGVCVQTETVLRQALNERIVPVLVINKLDRGFLELKLDPEDMYLNFVRIIESTNVLISTYKDEILGDDFGVFPERGNVAFAAGLQGWGFTLNQFAEIYAKKFKVDVKKMQTRLWGDHYYDKEAKKWTTNSTSASGTKLQRSFCQFILEPIRQIFEASMNDDYDTLEKLLSNISLSLASSDKQKKQKILLKSIMQKWLPADKAILEMAIYHLPSPKTSQIYRSEVLYSGPQDDRISQSIRNCDPNGPLLVYISKMVPTSDKSRFYAFGRVFSGTVKTGQKVRILGPNYEFGTKEDVFEKNIQRTVIMMGKKTEVVDSVPCGNTVALVGVDSVLVKNGTITDIEAQDCYPIYAMKFSVSAVVRVAVRPSVASDITKLAEGLKKLAKTDCLIQISHDENTKEHIVSGAGELQLEIVLKDLEENYMGGSKLVRSDPVVSYRETVITESNRMCITKSANNHNRLHTKAIPLQEELCEAVENLKILPRDDPKTKSKFLSEEFQWDPAEARKIWAFGPNTKGPNFLVDVTKGVQYLQEIKDSLNSSFQWVSSEGILMAEEWRGIRINIFDAYLHTDAIHRGGGQMIPAARKNFYACQLSANPRLLEPMFLVEIQSPQSCIGGIYQIINRRRGQIIEETQRIGTNLTSVKAHLPVSESFGFTEKLRQQTGGKAFPQCVFSHWKLLNQDPTDTKSKIYETVLATRKRKGMDQKWQPIENLTDRIN